MANITTRAAKGVELTYNEVDANFVALNAELPTFHAVAYGVVPNAADNTVAIQNVINAAYAATAGTLGGATVVFPPGLFNLTSVSRTFANSRTVKIQGAGRLATVFQKLGTDPTPVFDFSSGVTNEPSQGADFADFTIIGNAKLNPGIRLTLMAQFTFHRVSIFACSTALDLIGSLIFAGHNCVFTGNNNGIVTRKYPVAGFAGGGIFCNSWSFYGGTIQSNSTWGVDLGDADGVYFQGTNMERNGNPNNLDTATGAVIIRDTVDDESAYANINFNEVWFELNYGRMVEVEAAVGLGLTFRDCHTDGNPDGNSTINVGAIRQLSLINFPLLRLQNTVVSNAARTLIIGLDPYNYTDNSNTTRISSVLGSLALRLKNGISEPGTVADHGQLYVDVADTALKFKSAAGVVQRVMLAASEEVTTANVITAAESGKTFFLNNTAGFVSTLPAPALGLNYQFRLRAGPTTGSYVITTNGGLNLLTGTFQDVVGELETFSSRNTITFVGGVALYSDSLEVHSDGVGWHCRAFSRADGGITTSVTT